MSAEKSGFQRIKRQNGKEWLVIRKYVVLISAMSQRRYLTESEAWWEAKENSK